MEAILYEDAYFDELNGNHVRILFAPLLLGNHEETYVEEVYLDDLAIILALPVQHMVT